MRRTSGFSQAFFFFCIVSPEQFPLRLMGWRRSVYKLKINGARAAPPASISRRRLRQRLDKLDFAGIFVWRNRCFNEILEL